MLQRYYFSPMLSRKAAKFFRSGNAQKTSIRMSKGTRIPIISLIREIRGLKLSLEDLGGGAVGVLDDDDAGGIGDVGQAAALQVVVLDGTVGIDLDFLD